MKSRQRIPIWVLALCVTEGPIQAADLIAQGPTRRVSLAQSIELFRENSLQLRLARANLKERLGIQRQNRAYFNPTVSFWREDLDADSDRYDETLLTADQRLEWPGRTSARGRAAGRFSEAAEQRFLADSLRLVFEVQRRFLEAALAEERVGVLRATAVHLREAIADGEARFEDGDISAYELGRLRLELARHEQRLASAELDVALSRRSFALSVLPDVEAAAIAPDGLPSAGPPSTRSLATESVVEGRPDVISASLSVAAEDASASAAGQGWIPDLTLSGGYKDQSDGFSGLVLGAALDLPLFDRRGGEAGAAAARRSAAVVRLALTRREAENDLRSAVERYASVADRMDRVAGVLLGDAEELLTAATVGYAEGEMALLELLDAMDAYGDARLIALELRAEGWIAYYDLARAAGGEASLATGGEGR